MAKVIVREKIVSIDPTLIFQKMCIKKNTEDDLKDYLKHELAPFPLSLFDEKGMRKNEKSKFYDF